MTAEDPQAVDNTISGGTFHGPVIQARDVQASFQLPAAVPVALAQLPAEARVFTGREDDLAVLAGLLDPAGGCGAVLVSAVAGLAGVGKTTLAVRAGHAARRNGWFGGGVLFIDLHGYDDTPVDPGQALDALLRALGVPAEHIPPGVEERAALYRSVLAGTTEPVLVVADNASSEAQVRPLLPGAGPHKVLVTSRHTLAGLGARLVDITVLDPAASIELLDQALRTARPYDDRITADPQAAARLAGACGGLPLALQITAALLTADAALTPGELAGQLDDKAQRLAALRYDDGSARSVEAAFGLSVARLDPGSAWVFGLLAAAPGPDFSAESAAILADMPGARVRQVLSGLARAHLIEPAPGRAGRWRMHDLVRLYAQGLPDQDAQVEGRDQALDRLLGSWLDKSDAADDHLRSLPGMPVPGVFAGRAEALAWLDCERASLIAAVPLAAAIGREWAAMRLPMLLAVYLDWRRQFDDMIAITQISLQAARRRGDQQSEADALTVLGNALARLRRFEEAITAHQDAAAIFRETGDRQREGMALANLGAALAEARRYEEAITACQEAAAIFRETGDRRREGSMLTNLGNAMAEVRRYQEAITAHQDAASILRESGDRHGEARVRGNLGSALRQVGRFEEAITACQEAAAIFRETGDRHGEGTAMNKLGSALLTAGRFEEAITTHQDAVAIYRETGDRQGEGTALDNLGIALQVAGRYDEAITAHEAGLAICRETGDRQGEGGALNYLGLALRAAGRYDAAITAHQDAAAIFREAGNEHSERQALDNLETARAGLQATPEPPGS